MSLKHKIKDWFSEPNMDQYQNIDRNQIFLHYRPKPKSTEYKFILELLDQTEKWREYGEHEVEKSIWKIIAEKASIYSEGVRESSEVKDDCPAGAFSIDNIITPNG